MTDFIVTEGEVLGIIVGISTLLTNAGVSKNMIPLANLALGIGLNFMLQNGIGWPQIVLTGMMAGLSASGLYNLSKGGK